MKNPIGGGLLPRARVVNAKPGLDGHDRGAKDITRAPRDPGFEVIYTGPHQTPEHIVATVIAEDTPLLQLSVLSGAHLTIVEKVIELLEQEDAGDLGVLVGGTIPDGDLPALEAMAVEAVFTTGSDIGRAVGTAHRLTTTPPTHTLEPAC
ncbi:cobalamin-dependent protein [Streptomyces malaysiensis]|uniref:cobalamin-dependent protein n=1 Tax=Streptomyces malaysiensis TaxID=92644 RepID=UPI002B2F6079|nr:cobalamin-dependent protein [Streptomyces malaysiensis]